VRVRLAQAVASDSNASQCLSIGADTASRCSKRREGGRIQASRNRWLSSCLLNHALATAMRIDVRYFSSLLLSGRLFDMMVGSILFAFLFLLSFIGIVGRIQAALLFNIKFANSLKRGRLLVRLRLLSKARPFGLLPKPTAGPATARCQTPCSPSNRSSLPAQSVWCTSK